MQARCTSSLVDCFYHLEDFDAMQKLADALEEGSPVLV